MRTSTGEGAGCRLVFVCSGLSAHSSGLVEQFHLSRLPRLSLFCLLFGVPTSKLTGTALISLYFSAFPVLARFPVQRLVGTKY